MSSGTGTPAAAASPAKKAVHVKWSGKTIALGTFPSSEADEKCARAKALTRAWRSTMRPKPSREWVMMELERLGVRVVSGRLGRKAGDEGDDTPSGKQQQPPQQQQQQQMQQGMNQNQQMAMMSGVASANPYAERNNSLALGGDDLNSLMARRNSSLGLSMMNDPNSRRGSLGSLGQQMAGLEGGDPTMPPHRPFVGGGAAAAYEAARHDHFTNKTTQQPRRGSSLGLGTLSGGNLGDMGTSVNANQHYEMLKLHHMNLLNEIQETTLMMNLYQQQQLQQQQQQLQQQATAEIAGQDPQQMAMLMQQQQQQQQNQQGLDQMVGAAQLAQRQRASLGLGTMGGAPGMQQQMSMMGQQQNGQQQAGQFGATAPASDAAAGGDAAATGGSAGKDGDKSQEERAAIESQIAQLREEIAQTKGEGGGAEKPGDAAKSSSKGGKRTAKSESTAGDESPAKKKKKKAKSEADDAGATPADGAAAEGGD